MSYRHFPSMPYSPGAGIDFTNATNQLEFKDVAVALPPEALTEICRVFRISIRGENLEDDVESVYDGKAPASFKLRLSVWLETSSNPALRIPPYILPKYPIYIEGKILSEVGQQVEETYQFYPDPVTSINKYKIYIPLYNNQIITVPYNPNMDPGHFYFPAYKNERVVVTFYYDKAYLKRFLDWRPTAQLPLETQGDHLLLGKTPVNRTSVRHTYENEQPVFEIERLYMQQQFDTELVRIAQGTVMLTVGTPLGAPPPGVPMSSGAGMPTGTGSPPAPSSGPTGGRTGG